MFLFKTFIFILCICLLFFFYFFNKNLKCVRENFKIDKNPNYLFWTGGYDSTFRLCELLIIHKQKVIPIYINYNLDSKSKKDFWVRKNRKKEMIAMKKIRKKLLEKFPYTKDLLMNTIFINENTPNKKYEKKFLDLNLWPFKRKVHQYLHLGKISYLRKHYIDIGVLGINKKTKFCKFLENNLSKENKNYTFLNLSKNHPLKYLKFPLFNRNKELLCKISKKYKFKKILNLSWSCWFPKNKKPCGKCPMCRQRYSCK